MPVKQVQLGKGGPNIPQMGFGTMGMCLATYGATLSDEERFKVLDRAYEQGNTHWDSSDFYGDSEELIGRWFKRTGKRSEIFLATKFGFLKTGSMTDLKLDSSAAYCKKACEASLKALDVDYIDLYYMHHANHATPIEETMRALVELQAEGKIKHIGLSAVSTTALLRALKIRHVAAVQTDYSPFYLDGENSLGTSLIPTCRANSVAIVAAMPLGRGMITSGFATGSSSIGADGDTRAKHMPRFQGANGEKNQKVMREFGVLAEKAGCTTAQLSLAWLMKQGEDVFPIPGTKRVGYLQENWAAGDVNLTDEMDREVRQFVEGADVAGDVIPAKFRTWYYTDTAEEK